MRRQLVLAIAVCLSLASGCTTARVTIRSAPSDARVSIDGKPVGNTPLDLSLRKESHRVRIEKQGYAPIIGYVSPIQKDATALTLLLFPYYWIFATDAQYTFEDAYDYDLRPVVGPPSAAEGAAPVCPSAGQ